MCGIFALVTRKGNAVEKVFSGLKKLEYRGYDSWGIAWKEENKIKSIKKIGKISDFSSVGACQWQSPAVNDNQEKDSTNRRRKTSSPTVCEIPPATKQFVAYEPVTNNQQLTTNNQLAIGHSRWATHGKVTLENAHPHFSPDHQIALVHNGIIENFLDLKKELEKDAYQFSSQTDTEIIVHLLDREMKKGAADLEEACLNIYPKLEGRFAIVCLNESDNSIVAVRHGSPLILGVGHGEYFLASDIPAFLEETKQVNYIDDGEMVVLSEQQARFINIKTQKPVKKRDIKVDWQTDNVSKGEYQHFMIKEILEQKETIYRAINQNPQEIEEISQILRRGRGIFLIGCGTASKVCAVGEYFLSQIADIHTNPVVASEFTYYEKFLGKKNLIIAVSQSGETADVIEALEIAKRKKAKILSLTNVPSSTVARLSDFCFKINAGPEQAVASTKAASAQIAILLLVAFAVKNKLKEGRRVLIETASQINDMLNPRYEKYIEKQARKIFKQENMYIIGKGANFPIAMESAIKIQEVSYIHAEGFAAGELKHGPIALVSNKVPCIILGDSDSRVQREVLSNAEELKARGGLIIGIAPQNAPVFDIWIRVPDCGPAQALVNLIPIQILSYYLAVLRGLNPDMPRNLAKSVTVK